MSLFIFLYLIAGIFLVLFGVSLVLGIIYRKKAWIIFSVISFLICAVSVAYATHLALDKLKPWDFPDRDIYAEKFGDTSATCVTVLNKSNNKDVVNTWIEFRTCPAEIERVIHRKQLVRSIISADDSGYLSSFKTAPPWWQPSRLGDTVLLFNPVHYSPFYKELLIVTMDSTHAFYADHIKFTSKNSE